MDNIEANTIFQDAKEQFRKDLKRQFGINVAIKISVVKNANRLRYHTTLASLSLQKLISEYAALSWNDITGVSQSAELVMYRSCYCYFQRKYQYGVRSLAALGQDIGDRDHTTVIHGCRNFENLLTTNEPKYTALFNYIKPLFVYEN